MRWEKAEFAADRRLLIATVIIDNCAAENLCKITGNILLDFIPAIKIIIKP